MRDVTGAIVIDLVVGASSAAAAGLRPGDVVATIDGAPASRFTGAELRDALTRPVELEVRRPGHASPFRVGLACDSAGFTRVESAFLRDGPDGPDGVGWIRIPMFYPGSSMDVVDAVRSLRDGGARALVLDLRGNPGGVVADALVMADLFVGEGRALVAFGGRSRAVQAIAMRDRHYASTASEADFEGPIVALVDASSASASELLAMALRDAGRARIVGERTFGKGVAQLVIPVGVPPAPGAPRRAMPLVDFLSVTALRFVSGSGAIDLHGSGLEPDVAAAAPAVPEGEFVLARAAASAIDAYLDAFLPVEGDEADALARNDDGDVLRYPGGREAWGAIGAPDDETARRLVRARLRFRRLLSGHGAGPDVREDGPLRAAWGEALRLLGDVGPAAASGASPSAGRSPR